MRDKVLFVCEGVQHLASTVALAKHLKKIGIDPCLFYRRPLTNNADRHIFKYIIDDQFAVPGLLQHIGLVIFLTNESSPFCMVSNRIGFIAKRTGTPTITIQHGWIQPGLNYYGDSQKIGFIGRGSDNSAALWHFSPVLKYFGEDGIGYPTGQFKQPIDYPRTEKINVLVSTNHNWNVYSRENIVGLLRSLLNLQQNFPFLNFMHRPHPAEKSQSLTSELGIYMETLGIKEGSWLDIDSAIDWSDVVISTPSTAVFDAYFKGIPTFVYKFNGFEDALSYVEGIVFNNGRELSSLFSSLLTNKLYSDPDFPSFKPEIFEKHVKNHFKSTKPFSLTEEDFLKYADFCKA